MFSLLDQSNILIILSISYNYYFISLFIFKFWISMCFLIQFLINDIFIIVLVVLFFSMIAGA